MLLKVTLLHGCFSRFLNCINGTKSCKTSHMKRSLFKLSSRYHRNLRSSRNLGHGTIEVQISLKNEVSQNFLIAAVRYFSALKIINRSSHQRCSVEICVLKNFTKLQENTCARVSFSIKLQVKRDSDTGVFL